MQHPYTGQENQEVSGSHCWRGQRAGRGDGRRTNKLKHATCSDLIISFKRLASHLPSPPV